MSKHILHGPVIMLKLTSRSSGKLWKKGFEGRASFKFSVSHYEKKEIYVKVKDMYKKVSYHILYGHSIMVNLPCRSPIKVVEK